MLDQRVNMSIRPIQFGSAVSSGLHFILAYFYVNMSLSFHSLGRCDALQCRTEATLHNHS